MTRVTMKEQGLRIAWAILRPLLAFEAIAS
jgi:hypothetical protein